jgi:heme-degrading monooxygenase HmoA
MERFQMFVVTNRIPVAKGREADFEERFRQRAGLVEGCPGFVWNRVLRPVNRRMSRQTGDMEETREQAYYLIQTCWRSEGDFWNWTQSDAFRQAHASRPDPAMFAGENQLEIHEIVFDTSAG